MDFADVRTVMSEMGMAVMGSGISAGAERAHESAESAISSPLLEDVDIAGAKGILVNVTANASLSIGEFDEIGSHIKGLASDDATVVVGTVIDEAMGDNLRVTLVATGIGSIAQARPVSDKPTMKLVEAPVVKKATSVDEEIRPDTGVVGSSTSATGKNQDYDLDYLDIPTFLRTQAD